MNVDLQALAATIPDAAVYANDELELDGSHVHLLPLFLAPDPETFLEKRVLELRRVLLDAGIDSIVSRSTRHGAGPFEKAQSVTVDEATGAYVWFVRLTLLPLVDVQPAGPVTDPLDTQEAGVVGILIGAAALVAALAAFGFAINGASLIRASENLSRDVRDTARAGVSIARALAFTAALVAAFYFYEKRRR